MRISEVCQALVPNHEGIYVADGSERVSYPQDGHAACLQVEDHSFWFRHRNACIAALVERYPFDGTLLDLGGGNGFVSQMLRAAGHDVVLLEPGYAGALNARRQRQLDQVVCATVQQAAFPPASFGAIGLFDVIEHVEDDHAFLDELTPLLHPGGRLYLTVPCHQWLWSQADVDAGHFRRHTLRSMRTLLADHFEVDYISYFFQPLVLPQWLLRALPWRIGLGRQVRLSDRAEHGAGDGFAARLLARLLEGEAATIAHGARIRFGASCLVAARRRD